MFLKGPRDSEGFSFIAKKIIVLIDGGFLRVRAVKAGNKYDPSFIERFAHGCKGDDEEILRILYYDCAPYSGTVKLPVSGKQFTLKVQTSGSKNWRAKTCLLYVGES